MSDCKDDECQGSTGPDSNKKPVRTTSKQQACKPLRPGSNVRTQNPYQDKTCKPFQLTKLGDAAIQDQYVNESLTIGGADLNVYKLLGVHEQGKLVDQVGKGSPLTGGDSQYFPAQNAFDVYNTEWRSLQRGPQAIKSSAFIGYDFGVLMTDERSRRRYGIEANVRKDIGAIKIKQSSDPNKRVTKARIERSDDNAKWYGVAVVDLPDDNCLNTIYFSQSVPMRYWRIRPVNFNGGDEDQWSVLAVQMFEYSATETYNIQDKLFLENRDRDYADEPTLIKASYDMVDVTTELTKYGIELPAQTIYVMVHFSGSVAALGRPLVIGDIVEIPSEAQFTPNLERIEKWMEVTDIAWSTEGYTPGWLPTMQRVVMQPAYATQETQDIFGDLAEDSVDTTGLQDVGDGQHPMFQDYSDISDAVEKEAEDAVPVSGRETSSTIRHFTDEEVQNAEQQGLKNLNTIGQRPTALYTEDAMPPNNQPFTEGNEFPENPKHGDYHRLTYEHLDQYIPAHLYRYSKTKGTWVFLERDRRAEFDPNKPKLQEFLTSDDRRPHTHIIRDQDQED